MARLRDIMKVMDSGEKFSIGFIKWDEKRNTGGEKVETLEPVAYKIRKFQTEEPAILSKMGKPTHSRNPNHGVHYTTNIQLPGKPHPITVHLRLVYQFNGKRVYW